MAGTLLLQLLIMVDSLQFIYLFMQILLEKWTQIVYKTGRINAFVCNDGVERYIYLSKYMYLLFMYLRPCCNCVDCSFSTL
jgi:hypothetical protein